MKTAIVKLTELIELLEDRENKSSQFFSLIRESMRSHEKMEEAIDLFLSSASITQYADLSSEETALYNTIYDLLENINSRKK